VKVLLRVIKRIAEYVHKIRRSPAVKNLLDQIRSNVSLVITSCGPLLPKTGFSLLNHRSAAEMLGDYGITPDWLEKKHLAGDLNYAFFDEHGRASEMDFFVTLRLNDLAEMIQEKEKEVVLTAGQFEVEQVKTLLTAELRTFNVLVTDQAAAEHLLS
jgi:DNA-binding transcriptional regulator LsrR (DeoR family)